MKKKLLIQGLIKYLVGVLIVGALIFVPAGTLSYKNGWLMMGVLFIPILIMGIVLMIKNPELLKKRLDAKEKEKEQKEVTCICGLMFIIGFIIAGLNYRYQWITIPHSISIVGSIIFLITYLLYAEVLRENTYLSRVVEVQKNQKVIDTGLYGIIRHPMYSITIIMFLMIPIILESPISFLIFLIYPIIIIKRIKNEELLLEKDLKEYKEYQRKVKFKLIPWIW